MENFMSYDSVRSCRVNVWSALLVGLISLPSISFAQYIEYEVKASGPGGSVVSTTPGDANYTFQNEPSAMAKVTITSSPVASVRFDGLVNNPLGSASLAARGQMIYGFEVEAAPFTSVPVDFTGLYSIFQGATGYAQAYIEVQAVLTDNKASFQATLLAGTCSSGCLQFETTGTTYTAQQPTPAQVNGSFQGTLNMLTDGAGKVQGTVYIVATGQINESFAANLSNSAFIDPHLEINENFLIANPGAMLTIAPGVGNEILAAVPEPHEYALMLAGLATIMLAVRRRRSPNARS
jgi:hypothetical protein